MLSSQTLSELMSPCVVVRACDPLDRAAELVARAGAPYAAVLEDNGELVGLFGRQELECARLVRPDACAGDLFCTGAERINLEASPREAARRMRAHGGGALAVVEGEAIVGVLTAAELGWLRDDHVRNELLQIEPRGGFLHRPAPGGTLRAA